MKLLWQMISCWLSVIAAALVLILPATAPYALQFLAGSIVVFFLVSRWHRHRHGQFNLTADAEMKSTLNVVQTAIIGFGVLLLLGSTGGLGSWLLSLYFIYFLFLAFVSPLACSVTTLLLTIAFFYYFTPDFGAIHYGHLLSLVVYAPIALYTQNFYSQLVAERNNLQLEREKVAYYNLYAEKQQAALLAQGSTSSAADDHSLLTFVKKLVPQIDELQKMSRFPQNQLVVSSQLTKLGLSLRQALKKATSRQDSQS